jgi:two-component system LytT family response regulator
MTSVQLVRVVLADDERPARSYLRNLLENENTVRVVGEAANGSEAVAMIEREAPDLALLDLQMPELDGLEVVQMLRPDRLPLVAFVTAYEEYAVRAFELNAVDYLLTPVDATRLRRTITRAQEYLSHRDVGRTAASSEFDRVTAASSVIARHAVTAPLRRIPVRRRDTIIFVAVEEVASVTADGELLWITTLSGERHVITYRLKDLATRLDDTQFIQLSRGALVNVDAIATVNPSSGGTYVVTLKNRQTLGVSRIRARALRDTLFRL